MALLLFAVLQSGRHFIGRSDSTPRGGERVPDTEAGCRTRLSFRAQAECSPGTGINGCER
jgi:hypothetical protein